MNHYHLVEWEKEDGEGIASVSVVPDKWLVLGTNSCKWPRNASTQLIRANAPPGDNWPTYRFARIKRSGTDWEQMKRWETRFQEGTDVDTQEEEGRPKRNCKRRFFDDFDSSTSEDESNTTRRPPPPKPQSSPPVSTPSRHPVSSFLLPSPPPRPVSSGDLGSESDSLKYMLKTYFGRMLVKFEKLGEENKKLREELGAIRQQLESLGAERRGVSHPELPVGFNFPLDSLEDIQELDRKLFDSSILDKTTCYLQNLGGKDHKESMRLCGAALMTPRLQGCYSRTGNSKAGQQKAAFCQLANIDKALFNAVNNRHGSSRQIYNSALSDWLTTYKDRLPGGKANRHL